MWSKLYFSVNVEVKKLNFQWSNQRGSSTSTVTIWVFCLVIRKTNKKHGFRFSYLSKVLVHGERNPYPCSKCDASFLRMSDLDQHKQLAHEKSNGHPETCTHCESTYRRYY